MFLGIDYHLNRYRLAISDHLPQLEMGILHHCYVSCVLPRRRHFLHARDEMASQQARAMYANLLQVLHGC